MKNHHTPQKKGGLTRLDCSIKTKKHDTGSIKLTLYFESDQGNTMV